VLHTLDRAVVGSSLLADLVDQAVEGHLQDEAAQHLETAVLVGVVVVVVVVYVLAEITIMTQMFKKCLQSLQQIQPNFIISWLKAAQ
jgi:hypothetical protein